MYPYSPSHLVYTSVHDQKADQRVQRKDFPGILDVHITRALYIGT